MIWLHVLKTSSVDLITTPAVSPKYAFRVEVLQILDDHVHLSDTISSSYNTCNDRALIQKFGLRCYDMIDIR